MDISKLKIIEPIKLQGQAVSAVLLALGSNYRADFYLPLVRENLATLGKLQLSSAFKNSDFTATVEQPKPDYTNQCVYLDLDVSLNLQQLQQTFKQLENGCHRQRQHNPDALRLVTMDIDILLIKTMNDGKWMIMADRYPFKAHESIGIDALTVNK